MDVRNCKRCGKIYNYDGFRNCPTCRREDEDDFKKIKEYLYENSGANISDVEQATGIDSGKIIEFLRQNRLEIGEGSNLILECESCGISIRSGRFCDKCTHDLQKEMGASIKTPEKRENPKETGKFRVVDKYKNRR